jgi:hypothetical protein
MIFKGDSLEVLKSFPADSVDSLVTDPPAGISFMGKGWDSDKGGREGWVTWMTEVMAECFRVLKPGAHGLVWAIPRTSHWTATALENAGFEVRDVVTHLFGTGFPKSLDISKAIDKAAGAERPIVGRAVYGDGHVQNSHESMGYGGNEDGADVRAITAPATDAAREWQGWGTALKPASEHWILVRKPLGEKTVAANVLRHGTGGINIDGCRIASSDPAWSISDDAKPRTSSMAYENKKGANSDSMIKNRAGCEGSPLGRFPANLVLSHNPDCGDQCSEGCAVGGLDGQSGVLKGGGSTKVKSETTGSFGLKGYVNTDYPDSGGASRFFYCAKASKSDRGEGNTHPTVKSSTLMAYLVRLVTPPSGVVLDPFMGSGSTGVAAQKEGFSFLGIEQDEGYFAIAEVRLGA